MLSTDICEHATIIAKNRWVNIPTKRILWNAFLGHRPLATLALSHIKNHVETWAPAGGFPGSDPLLQGPRHTATSSFHLLQAEVWTGQKYQNSNRRFPNFNFSMFDTDDYLFLVTHPLAITGVYASGPLTDAMPDPQEAFADELALEEAQEDQRRQSDEETTWFFWGDYSYYWIHIKSY